MYVRHQKTSRNIYDFDMDEADEQKLEKWRFLLTYQEHPPFLIGMEGIGNIYRVEFCFKKNNQIFSSFRSYSVKIKMYVKFPKKILFEDLTPKIEKWIVSSFLT